VSFEILGGENQAISGTRGHLHLGSCPPLETRFEIVRAVVWSLAAPSRKAHINRVISAALPPWTLLSQRTTSSEETRRQELRGALAMLEDAGDLVAQSGGYWSPAATRIVMLPEKAGNLLVGGAPTALLNLEEGSIQFHGPHRHLADIPPVLEGELPFEHFSSWTKRPESVSLREWSREIYESFERSPYTTSSEEAFEFYLPEASKQGVPQFLRWFESASEITGTLLARRRRLYGAREYRLVDVRKGRIVSACNLHDVDVRRLMYALDLEVENPVRVRPRRVGEHTEWLFRSELPRAEQRAFAAIGNLQVSDERRFERRWTFTRNEALALDMMRSLGIALMQDPQEDQP
jgi:hypothetical protein